MFMADKKKPSTVIVARMKAGKSEEAPAETNEMGDEVDSSIGLDSAAEEILAAVKSGDAKALKEALSSFMELCESPATEDAEQE